MANRYRRPMPKGTKRLATGCQYCAVGCGYNAFLVPEGTSETEELEGVSRFITPAMRNRVRYQGIPHDIAVAPDVLCDLNKGNHSVRGGSQGHNLVSFDGSGASTRERLVAPKIRLADGTWYELTWTQLNALLGRLVVGAADVSWDAASEKIDVKRPEAVGAKVFEYQYLENTFAFTKLFYSALGTPNVAYHDRPGAAGSSPGMADAGLRPHDFSYEEVIESDVLVLIGTNPYENQSVFFMQHCAGKEMVVLDPRRTATANYAVETGGLHVQLPKLGVDSLILYGLAHELLSRWQASHGSLDDYPWRDRIATETDVNWSLRRQAKALTFEQFTNEFLKVGDANSPYRLEALAQTLFPEKASEVVASLRALADRIDPDSEGGERRKVGILYEKGMIWGFNYHNTAAVASLGLLLGAYSEPGRFVGRVGGHQKGWASSKADMSQDFHSQLANAPNYMEGYPFRNVTDTYSDDDLTRVMQGEAYRVHHNLDNHVFGPPADLIEAGSEEVRILRGEPTPWVRLKNGVRTKRDPDVRLLFIIGGNYLGQTNDAAGKRDILAGRLAAGSSLGSIARPTRAQMSNLDAVADMLIARMKAGGLVAVHQEVYENPTSEFCDLLIPAAGWGEDDFCRYNAQRRLKLYSRIQDSPLHPDDQQRIEQLAAGDASKLDPFRYRDGEGAPANAEIYQFSPKPDWMIFRDLGRTLIKQVAPVSHHHAILGRAFNWTDSAAVADEMAIYSQRGLAGANADTGQSMLGDVYLFGRHQLGLTTGVLHKLLGAGQDDATAPLLQPHHYSVVKSPGVDSVHANQVATNGIFLPVRGLDSQEMVVTQPISISGGVIDGSARGALIKHLRGSLRSPKRPPHSLVGAEWTPFMRQSFDEFTSLGSNEVFVTNGRFNHLWNNMFHHLRNDYVAERYPEDLPGTILEVNPSWAMERSIENGDVVTVTDGSGSFTAIASLQDSVPSGGAFAMFSYPVRESQRFNFRGYVNNITHGYSDGINPIAALKYGRGVVTKTGLRYQSVTRRGPTYEQRNRIRIPTELDATDWEMRELVVKKGLPRAFRHGGPTADKMHAPESMLAHLTARFPQSDAFEQYLEQVMKWDIFAGTSRRLIDEWHPAEIRRAVSWHALRSAGQPVVSTSAMLELLDDRRDVALFMHDNIVIGENTLSTLFERRDYQAILRFLVTATAQRAPYAGLKMIEPGRPEESAFYLHTGIDGVMAGHFTPAERQVIRDWISNLTQAVVDDIRGGRPTITDPGGTTMLRFERVKQILDNSVAARPTFGAHGAFWRSQTRDQFVAFSFAGETLVTIGNGAGSGIIKALRGEAPFGVDIGTPGARFRRMPGGLPPVPDDEIKFIEDWIDAGCPNDEVPITGVPAPPPITIAPHGGGPLSDPQTHLDYWRDFDDWAMFQVTPEMRRDINTVMSVAGDWMAYALDPSLEAQWEGVSVGSSLVLDPTLRIADRHIETLAKHYGNPIPLLTVLDGYERFGADSLPNDPARPADERHNMNGATMWFFWAAFADTCLRHGASGGWSAEFLDVVRGHTRAIIAGLMNDGLFRGRFQVPGFEATEAGRVAVRDHVRGLSDQALIAELTKRYAESGFGTPVPTPTPTPPPVVNPGPSNDPATPNGGVAARRVYRIHPAIGMARVGNSQAAGNEGWYLGPEVPDWRFLPPDGRFRDSSNQIRREGVRFRIYEYTYPSHDAVQPTSVREITSQDAEIQWFAHLANLKSFERDANNDRQPVPNDPGQKSVSGLNHQEDVIGSVFGHAVQLGTLKTDELGRLIVLGGFGRAASPAGRPLGGLFNAGWYDDVADGPIRATIRIHGSGEQPPVEPAWVVTGVPAYATSVVNIVTMYDLALDLAIQGFNYPVAPEVSFTRDIYPILARATFMQWASGSARAGHGPGSSGNFLAPALFDLLRNNGASSSGARNGVFVRLKNPGGGGGNMPPLFGLALTPHQYELCRRWRDGQFLSDWPSGRAPDDPPEVVPFTQLAGLDQALALDEASLFSGVGGSFNPGIEVGERFSQLAAYTQPFRIDPAHGAGYLTETLSIPWQADFNLCGHGWWPGGRPNSVSGDGVSFHNWVPFSGMDEMVQSWWKLGFLKQEQLNGQTVILEREVV